MSEIKPEYVMRNYQNSGKDFITHPGLLDLVHQDGISEMRSEVLQIPNEQNGWNAVVKATVVLASGQRFEGTGEGSSANIKSPSIKQTPLMMAETRAYNRAMRLATNRGETSAEELGESVDRQTGEIRERTISTRLPAPPPSYTVTEAPAQPEVTIDDIGKHPPSSAWARWETACDDARRAGVSNPWAKAVTPDMGEDVINTWAAKLEKRIAA